MKFYRTDCNKWYNTSLSKVLEKDNIDIKDEKLFFYVIEKSKQFNVTQEAKKSVYMRG